jgi:hypothetical protein
MATDLNLGSAVAVRRLVLARRIRFLVAATIAYNVIEAVVAITAGTIASSSALVGFGLDSVIEVASAVAVADHEARQTGLRTGPGKPDADECCASPVVDERAPHSGRNLLGDLS